MSYSTNKVFFARNYLNYIACFIWQVDKLTYKEQMASILLKLGRFEEAEKMYRVLLFMNPDNYRYKARIAIM
jgi:tetratricopeptide (TPR) repeat protein